MSRNRKKVRYHDVYPGIDVVFYGNSSKLEYDFVLQRGADPSRIRLSFDGIDSMCVEGNGDLVLKSGSAEFRNFRPLILQDGRPIAGRWTILGKRRAGFVVDVYDRTQPLVIDPVLTYATFLGGSDIESATSIAIDSQGNLIVAGGTQSSDFPTTSASLYPGYPAAKSDPLYPFVVKINPAASGTDSLVYSTYFNSGYGVEFDGAGVDGAENERACGLTRRVMHTLRVSHGLAFQLVKLPLRPYFNNVTCPNRNGKSTLCPDAFVAEISATGNQLLFSSYLGGSEIDGANALAVDAAGNIYLGGYTNSQDFPLAGNSLPFVAPSGTGAQAAFVAKISASRSLVYSTYFGASSSASIDTLLGLAVDAKGLIYISGFNDNALPVTAGALQTAYFATTTSAYAAIL